MISLATMSERRVSRAAEWARWTASFSFVLLVTAAVGHRYGLVETPAFIWLLGIVAGLAFLSILMAAFGLSRLWFYGEKGGRASTVAVLISLLVLAPFAYGTSLYMRYPPLTDVSTDLADLPRFVFASRARSEQMNPIGSVSRSNAALQVEAFPEISGRRFPASMDRVMKALKVVLVAEGWTPRQNLPNEITVADYTFEATAPTSVLRFPSDAAIRLTDEGESVYVDLRLSQRYFPHDLGSGARRIHRFMSALEAEFAKQSLEIIDIPASAGEEDAAN